MSAMVLQAPPAGLTRPPCILPSRIPQHSISAHQIPSRSVVAGVLLATIGLPGRLTAKRRSKRCGPNYLRRATRSLKPAAEIPTTKVVLVGPSQSGKTTFLDLMHQMYEVRKPDTLHVGHGNKSTTLTPTVYRFPKLRELSYSPFLEEKDVASSREDVMEAFLGRADYKACVKRGAISNATQFGLEIIDTPGYDDDTAHRDEEHALQVLKKLHHAGSVSAFVLVVGKGICYGGSFQRVFKQYWNTFEGFQDRFVILHTKWNPIQEDDFHSSMDKRISDFKDIFPEARNLQHIFIECKWGKKPRFLPEHAHALAAESLNRLFSHLTSFTPKRTKDLEYLKTPHMLDVERKLISFIEGRGSGATRALQNVKSEHAKNNERYSTAYSDLEKKRGRLVEISDRLSLIDCSTFEEGGRKRVEEWGNCWLFGKEKDVSINCEHRVRGYNKGSHSSCRWESVTKDGNVLCGTLKSQWGWHKCEGYLVALVSKKDIHQVEIAELKLEMRLLACEISNLEKRTRLMKDELDMNQDDLKKLHHDCEFIGKCKGHLIRKSMSIHEFIKSQHVYKTPEDMDTITLFDVYCSAAWNGENLHANPKN